MKKEDIESIKPKDFILVISDNEVVSRCMKPKDDFFELSIEEKEKKLRSLAKHVEQLALCDKASIFKAQFLDLDPPLEEQREKAIEKAKTERRKKWKEEPVHYMNP